MKKIFFIVLSLAMIVSCQKETSTNGSTEQQQQAEPDSYTVCGKVEKGPFVQGSTITMATLDSKLNATGKTYSATISDDTGTFGFGAQTFDSPYARLTATGYFYNEVTGELSTGTLTLSALVDLSDRQSVNVNILTHLKAIRIQKLISEEGKSFGDANAQAQTEILNCFGYGDYAGTDVSEFSITSGTDEAAALIIVSSQIQVNRTEAQITEFLSKLATDFAEDGTFSESNKEDLQKGVSLLYNGLDYIKEGIVNRYSSLGLYVTVKDLKTYVDWDGDGVPGNEYLKEGDKVTLSKDSIDVPAEGGTYNIEVNSPVTVYAEKLTHGNIELNPISSPVLSEQIYADGITGAMNVTKSLDGNVLTVSVGESTVRRQQEKTIELYTYDGTVAATLNVKQAAAENVELVGLSETGEMLFNDILYRFAQAMTMAESADKYYTLCKNHPQMKAPLDPDNYNINNLWSYFYQFNYRLSQLRKGEMQQRGIYTEFFDIYSAIAYYNMVVLWGDVPYIVEPNPEISFYPRESAGNILAKLASFLTKAIDYAPDKRNVAVATRADDALFLSKDVARIALANIYMYQGKYSDAQPLLEAVVNTRYYSLDTGEASCPNSKDCIFATNSASDTKTVLVDNQYTMIYCYSDVLLSLSECEYMGSGGVNSIKYVNQVLQMCGQPAVNTDILENIKKCRKYLQLPSYFAFLKRTGLAKTEVGYKDYQLLWPIPTNELTNNPYMSQNNGY